MQYYTFFKTLKNFSNSFKLLKLYFLGTMGVCIYMLADE